jgi:hypothetical protein
MVLICRHLQCYILCPCPNTLHVLMLMHFPCPCRNTNRSMFMSLPLPSVNRNAHALLNANSGLVRLIPVRETSKTHRLRLLGQEPEDQGNGDYDGEKNHRAAPADTAAITHIQTEIAAIAAIAAAGVVAVEHSAISIVVKSNRWAVHQGLVTSVEVTSLEVLERNLDGCHC